MTRPAGVTASAVVAIAGSVVTLLFSVMFIAVANMELPPGTTATPVPDMRVPAYVMSAVTAAMGIFGIATAVGVLRLRSWARTAVLVFASIMGIISFMGLVVVALMRSIMPETDGPISPDALRGMLLVIYGVPLVVSVWWVVQFNLRSTKAAFADGTTGGAPQRPVSISIIGWFNIVGGLFTLGAAATGTPAFVLGQVLTGWAASLAYVFMGGVSTYLGWHLLTLDPHARILTIWWFVITICHTGFMALTPSVRARMREFQEAYMSQQGGPPPPFDPTHFTVGIMLVTIVLLGGAIWPLVSNRAAFEERAHDAPAA